MIMKTLQMTLACCIKLRARNFGLRKDVSVRDLTVVVPVQGTWEDYEVVNPEGKADLLFIVHCFVLLEIFF